MLRLFIRGESAMHRSLPLICAVLFFTASAMPVSAVPGSFRGNGGSEGSFPGQGSSKGKGNPHSGFPGNACSHDRGKVSPKKPHHCDVKVVVASVFAFVRQLLGGIFGRYN
jgi:hypothetical protein